VGEDLTKSEVLEEGRECQLLQGVGVAETCGVRDSVERTELWLTD